MIKEYSIINCSSCNDEFIILPKNIIEGKSFCSRKCSNRRIHSKETKLKISNSLSGTGMDNVTMKCTECSKEFTRTYNKRNQLTCSNSCAAKHKWKDKEFHAKMSTIASKRAYKRHSENDSSFGWQSRDGITPSYPETIAISLLDNMRIKYEREFKVSRYFIDFALHESMIAIEIDGQQHNLPERKLSDKRKDSLLYSLGWTVHRIKYPEENIIDNIKLILASISSA